MHKIINICILDLSPCPPFQGGQSPGGSLHIAFFLFWHIQYVSWLCWFFFNLYPCPTPPKSSPKHLLPGQLVYPSSPAILKPVVLMIDCLIWDLSKAWDKNSDIQSLFGLWPQETLAGPLGASEHHHSSELPHLRSEGAGHLCTKFYQAESCSGVGVWGGLLILWHLWPAPQTGKACSSGQSKATQLNSCR